MTLKKIGAWLAEGLGAGIVAGRKCVRRALRNFDLRSDFVHE
ncbi:hypothetical protein [Variovorax sp. Sphag1AA]|nr:hypothetical protein [Variovorax sp. Sphag1AA]MBB3177288.1 hypothetical protein [Variovorax sp. Sphag1AA]